MMIRPYLPADWNAVWGLLEPVFRAGETYTIARDITEPEAQRFWTSPPKHCFVAADATTGEILGTYFLRTNQEGPGAHVCNAGYIVSAAARGRGVASQLCLHSQEEARRQGYRAMQFNCVVSTNVGAVRLWHSLGFETVGTLPGAFAHPARGEVDAFVMYKRLTNVAGG